MAFIFLLFFFFLTVSLFLKALPKEIKEQHSSLQTYFIMGTVLVGIIASIAIFT